VDSTEVYDANAGQDLRREEEEEEEGRVGGRSLYLPHLTLILTVQ
jgi:hypothetical protein